MLKQCLPVSPSLASKTVTPSVSVTRASPFADVTQSAPSRATKSE